MVDFHVYENSDPSREVYVDFGSVTTVASTPAIQYKGPGVFTANLRIDGRPSQARNSSTAAEVSHRIDYTKQITIGHFFP